MKCFIFEINLDLYWSKKCVIVVGDVADEEEMFWISDTKLYVPIVILSTQDNAKLLEQLKSGFKRTIKRNKYQSKMPTKRPNQHLNYLINPSFQGVYKRFVLSFENETEWTSYKRFYLPTVEIKNYNVIIDGKFFFDQPVGHKLMTFGNIWKIATGPKDDYTVGCWLDYDYFKNYYKMMAIDLRKQQGLDADPKAIQQINFNGNPAQQAAKFFIIEELKKQF